MFKNKFKKELSTCIDNFNINKHVNKMLLLILEEKKMMRQKLFHEEFSAKKKSLN